METSTNPKHPLTTLASVQHNIRWTGGVIRPRGLEYRGKPMRVAAWIESRGRMLSGAIVDGHGPTVLRELLEELLVRTEASQRPGQLTVWPNARAAFRGLEYPPVHVEHDGFLTVVIEDEADSGQLWRLPVRRGK